MDERSKLLSVARGSEPADLVLRNGRVVNVFNGEVEVADVAVVGGRVAGVGVGYRGRESVDLAGAFLVPGLVDAHVHIESSLCVPAEFARAVVPRGVTTAVVDPHEIANVAGLGAVRWMWEASRGLALDVRVMAPSCVPATTMACGGAVLTSGEIAGLRECGALTGLAEVMNFPGVIGDDAELGAKIEAMRGLPIDGHCPGVRGVGLNAYAAAGVGSDHESVSAEEAREKLARGLYLLIREATNARNLETLLPVITASNSRRVCFCTDDRTPGDLLRDGSVDMMVRRAIAFGIAPVEAIRMATLNPAEWFGLRDVGAIAPGRRANFFACDDLRSLNAATVWTNGVRFDGSARPAGAAVSGRGLGRCVVDWGRVSFAVRAGGSRVRVIGARADQLVTEHLIAEARVVGGLAEADVSRDVLKMAVVERHGGSGKVGLGFISRFGLRRGAIAGTVAHDHHNLVIIGADDASMRAAGRAVTEMGGGLAVVDGGKVVARLALPVGGLMSDAPVEAVAREYDALLAAARSIGASLADPFMAMSFMALEVIPSLKLTEQGLVDVERFGFVSLFE
jgi:adenine deaminase